MRHGEQEKKENDETLQESLRCLCHTIDMVKENKTLANIRERLNFIVYDSM